MRSKLCSAKVCNSIVRLVHSSLEAETSGRKSKVRSIFLSLRASIFGLIRKLLVFKCSES